MAKFMNQKIVQEVVVAKVAMGMFEIEGVISNTK